MFSPRISKQFLYSFACFCFVASDQAFGASYQSVDFGSAQVGASLSPIAVTFSFSGLTAQPAFAARFGSDFTVASPACNAGWSTCTINATFGPTLSGLRADAIVATDGSGRVLATAYLHGVGLAPQVTLGHGKLVSRLTGVSGFNITSIALDPGGNLYFAENGPAPTVKKLAVGSNLPQLILGRSYVAGAFTENTQGTAMYLGDAPRFTVDAAGNLFFYTSYGGRIFKWDSVTGLVTTVAGGGSNLIFANGDAATSIKVQSITTLKADVLGNLYFATGNEIDRIDLNAGKVYKVAGNGTYTDSGDNGLAASAGVNVSALTVDRLGNLFIFGQFGGRFGRSSRLPESSKLSLALAVSAPL